MGFPAASGSGSGSGLSRAYVSARLIFSIFSLGSVLSTWDLARFLFRRPASPCPLPQKLDQPQSLVFLKLICFPGTFTLSFKGFFEPRYRSHI